MNICFICDQYENPFVGASGHPENPENFKNVYWILPNDGDNIPKLNSDHSVVHCECWEEYNR